LISLLNHQVLIFRCWKPSYRDKRLGPLGGWELETIREWNLGSERVEWVSQRYCSAGEYQIGDFRMGAPFLQRQQTHQGIGGFCECDWGFPLRLNSLIPVRLLFWRR
jgi:hypothetical protein